MRGWSGPGVEPGVESSTDDGSGSVTFRYDVGEAEPPGHALATVLSTLVGAGPTGIDPLGNHFDLDAMNRLLESTEGEGAISGSFVIDVVGLSLVVRQSAIVGVASRDAVEWAPPED